MMRFFIYLIFVNIGGIAFSQALSPEQHGGSKNKTLNLREIISPKYDFTKFNPDYQNSIPSKRVCVAVEEEEKRKAFIAGESDRNFESWLHRTIQEDPLIAKSTDIFTIPIVIHIVYSNVVENISDEQILSQLEVLNADYRHLNKDTINSLSRFRKVAGDMRIEFKLATRDPEGRVTNGIDRISMAGSPFTEKYINEVIKPNTIWNTSEYLNLWVCYIDNNVLGFSQFPESSGLDGIPSEIGTVFTDGVVITYTAFGTIGTVSPPFDKGRTATHEIGHWLGLRHIWGDGNDECSADDFCEDTPLSKGPNFGCKIGGSGCKDTAMVENFMDYTDDKCMSIFSQDQKKRIWSVLSNSPRRKELGTSKASEPLKTPPSPLFTSDITIGSQSLTVKFKDITAGKNKNRKWTFEGGNPATSTEVEPVVVFNKPGKYAVSLSLTNTYGTNTQTKDEYIIVNGAGEKLPIICDFEPNTTYSNVNILPSPWNNPWKMANTLGGYGKSSGAIWINNFANNRPGTRSYFMLPSLDFSTGSETQLSFDIAYKYFNSTYADTLGIYISIDDGKTFQAIYYKMGEKLAANDETKELYHPKPKDWRTEEIDLSRYDDNKRVLILFACKNGYGNNLYIDNIKVSSTPLPLPKIDFIADRNELCIGEQVGFTDNTANKPIRWLWSFPGATPENDTSRNPIVTYQQEGRYEVTLTAVNSTGEAVLSKKDFIRIKPSPQITVSPKPKEVCPGSPITIHATGGNFYLWMYGDRESNEKSITDTLFFSKSYEVVILGDSGCSVTERFQIQVKDEKDLEVEPHITKVCEGQTAQIVASGGVEYSWKNSAGQLVSNTNTLSIRATSSSKFNLSVKTESGCVFAKQVPVYVERRPTVTAQSTSAQICEGNSVQLKATGATYYIWNQQAEGKIWNITPAKTAKYSVVGTNEAGCKDTAEIEIKVNPLPKLSADPSSSTICEGGNVTLKGFGANNYFWESQDKQESAGSFVFTVSPIVSQNYYLMGISDKGCKDTITIPIHVQALQKAHIQAQEYAVCKNEPISFTVAKGQHIEWRNLTTQIVSSTDRFTITPDKTTLITATGIDERGCQMLPDTVEVHALQKLSPKAQFGYIRSKSICVGQSVQFMDSSFHARKYFWTFEGGTPANSTEENPRVVYKKAGKYKVSLVVEGCNESDTLTKYNFMDIQEVPRIQLLSDKPYLCFGESVNLTAIASGAASFEWSPSLGLNVNEGNAVIASPTDSTTYKVTATMPNGCKLSKSIALSVKKGGKELTISPENPSICLGETITLTATNGDKHYWSSIENNLTKSGPSITITPRKSGKYQLVASDSLNCPLKKEVLVTVFRRPRLTLDPPNALLCKGEQVMIEASGAGTYSWLPATGLSATIGKRVTAFPNVTQKYLVFGTDENGCKDTVQLKIGVSETPPVHLMAEQTKLCKGMATQITAEGGVEYNWLPFANLDTNKGNIVIANPPADITYVVNATADDGCTSKASITLHVNEMQPIPIIPNSPILCIGESITLETPTSYNFRWGEGIPIQEATYKKIKVNPKETTTYQINAWDENGCPHTGEVTVIVRSPKKVTIVAPQTVVCEGGTLILQATGSSQYNWLPISGLGLVEGANATINPQSNTIYKVVGTDEYHCKDTASFAVNTKLLQPIMEISPKSIDLAKEQGLVRFTDKTPEATQWLWNFGDGGTSDLQHTNHVYTGSGLYTVQLIVSNGICSKTISRQIEVINSSDVTSVERVGAFNLKTQQNGTVHISFQTNKEMAFILSISNEAKQELLSGKIQTNLGKYEQDIDISSFGKGKYILQIQDEKSMLAYPFEWQ